MLSDDGPVADVVEFVGNQFDWADTRVLVQRKSKSEQQLEQVQNRKTSTVVTFKATKV